MGLLPPVRRLGGLECIQSPGDGPATVLVNGAGVTLAGWHAVWAGIAALGPVFAWNRPGVGRSAKPRVAQTAAEVVATLRNLLRDAGLAPPYVLVGHSLGGLHVQWFARHHPDEVAAVLLLEATHPDDPRRLAGQEGRIAAALGRLFALPQQLFRANLHAEIDCIRATVRQIHESPAFPPLPLTVLSGGKAPPAWMVKPAAHAIRVAHQAALAQLAPGAEHRVAARSGHFPQLSEPQAVVDALAALRGRIEPPAV